MPEEYFDVAYINFEKAILHGRIRLDGRDEHGCVRETYVEQILTDDQIQAVQDLNSRHQMDMELLLASFVDREAANANAA